MGGSGFGVFPDYIRNKIVVKNTGMSDVYKSILFRKFDFHGQHCFRHLTNIFFHPGKVRPPEEPRVHYLIRHLVYKLRPALVTEDFILKDNPYGFTGKYPFAEYMSIAKYGNLTPPFNAYYLSASARMLNDCFSFINSSPLVDLDACVEWAERQTSPGFPWTLCHNRKADLLDSDIFKSWFKRWEAFVRAGGNPICFWRAFIKKELKKLTDIYAHSPRTILASPIEMTLLGYHLFGAQNERIARSGYNLDCPAWVGSTKFRRRWHLLALKLNSFPNINDGDCTRFDGTVQESVLRIIAEMRLHNLVDKGYELSVEWFYDNVIYSYILGWAGDVYMKTAGQPSGQPNTLVDNSLVHCVYWFYHWCSYVVPHARMRGIKLFRTWASFKEHVCLIVMGDDVIYSYSDVVKPFMLPEFVKATFAQFGVTFKSTVFGRPAQLAELEFCSTGFRLVDNIWIPFMKDKKLMASICYKGSDSFKLTLLRLMGLRIEAFWNEDVFQFINELIDAFIHEYEFELRRPPRNNEPTFDEIIALHWGVLRIRNHYLGVDA